MALGPGAAAAEIGQVEVYATVSKVRGALDRPRIEAAVAAHPGFAKCFGVWKGGAVRVSLTVRPDGSATKIKVARGSSRSSLEHCVVRAARNLGFEAAARSTTTTFTLKRGSSTDEFIASVDRDPGATAGALSGPAPAPAPAPAVTSVDAIAAKIHGTYGAGMRRCYNRSLAHEPSPVATAAVTVTIEVATNGTVTKATVTGMDAVKTCIGQQARRWRFGSLDADTAVTVQFQLSP